MKSNSAQGLGRSLNFPALKTCSGWYLPQLVWDNKENPYPKQSKTLKNKATNKANMKPDEEPPHMELPGPGQVTTASSEPRRDAAQHAPLLHQPSTSGWGCFSWPRLQQREQERGKFSTDRSGKAKASCQSDSLTAQLLSFQSWPLSPWQSSERKNCKAAGVAPEVSEEPSAQHQAKHKHKTCIHMRYWTGDLYHYKKQAETNYNQSG